MGFSGRDFADERPFAKLAADRFGTEHFEMTISAADFGAFLPRYVWHMEEPVCEPPAIALYYVSKLAREHVTVLLSGEGGDEAFAGYRNYRNLVWLERIKRGGPMVNAAFSTGLSRLDHRFRPFALRQVPASLARSVSGLLLQPYFESLSHHGQQPGPGLFCGLPLRSRSRIQHPLRCVDCRRKSGTRTLLQAMLYIDTKTWLPDDLLIKADKMTMANSVELRVPLLDHKVLEFAASLPPGMKLHGATTKYLLKKALSNRIPKEIRERKKTGFPVPYGSWMRNELKDMVWDVLLDRRTINRGYFRRDGVEVCCKRTRTVWITPKRYFLC